MNDKFTMNAGRRRNCLVVFALSRWIHVTFSPHPRFCALVGPATLQYYIDCIMIAYYIICIALPLKG
jgi:hypothetical protein